MITMSRYPDLYFDIAIVDPPYGIGVGKMAYLTEQTKGARQKNGKILKVYKNGKKYTKKDWDKFPPTQQYFDELKRISKHQIIFGIEYMNWDKVGTGRIKWNKGMSEKVSFKKYEIAYCSMITNEIEIPLLWAGLCQAKSISEPMTQQGNKKLNERRIHPCHKPILLYQIILQMFAKENMKIIDTHMGGLFKNCM